jgi:hypothetical protein
MLFSNWTLLFLSLPFLSKDLLIVCPIRAKVNRFVTDRKVRNLLELGYLNVA